MSCSVCEENARFFYGELANFGNGFAGNANGTSFRAQARSAAFGASRVSTVAAKKHANMELVFFALEIVEEAFDAVEFACGIAFEQQRPLVGGEMTPRNIGGYSLRAGEFLRFLHQTAITRLGPRLDRAVVERFAGVRNDEIEIEIDRVAESLATRARAPGIVETKTAAAPAPDRWCRRFCIRSGR